MSSAAFVDVAEGAAVRGIEIHVRRGRVFSIRGKVESVDGATPNNGNLALISKDHGHLEWTNFDGKKKTFQFKNILPGDYTIQTNWVEVVTKDPTGEFMKATPLVGRLEVAVEDHDAVNVVLQLHPGVEVRAKFKVEGTDQPKPFGEDAPRIHLQAAENDYHWEETEKDGSFRARGLANSEFRVHVEGLRENDYVKAIHFDGQDINGKDLDLSSSSGGEMEVVLSPNGAEVTGIVRDADGKPVPGAVVQIGEKTVNADQNGAFDFKGIAPGEYKLFAWEDRGDGIISDPDFQKSFDSIATPLKLAEKSRENIEPVLITKGAMAAEAAKIQ